MRISPNLPSEDSRYDFDQQHIRGFLARRFGRSSDSCQATTGDDDKQNDNNQLRLIPCGGDTHRGFAPAPRQTNLAAQYKPNHAHERHGPLSPCQRSAPISAGTTSPEISGVICAAVCGPPSPPPLSNPRSRSTRGVSAVVRRRCRDWCFPLVFGGSLGRRASCTAQLWCGQKSRRGRTVSEVCMCACAWERDGLRMVNPKKEVLQALLPGIRGERVSTLVVSDAVLCPWKKSRFGTFSCRCWRPGDNNMSYLIIFPLKFHHAGEHQYHRIGRVWTLEVRALLVQLVTGHTRYIVMRTGECAPPKEISLWECGPS